MSNLHLYALREPHLMDFASRVRGAVERRDEVWWRDLREATGRLYTRPALQWGTGLPWIAPQPLLQAGDHRYGLESLSDRVPAWEDESLQWVLGQLVLLASEHRLVIDHPSFSWVIWDTLPTQKLFRHTLDAAVYELLTELLFARRRTPPPPLDFLRSLTAMHAYVTPDEVRTLAAADEAAGYLLYLKAHFMAAHEPALDDIAHQFERMAHYLRLTAAQGFALFVTPQE